MSDDESPGWSDHVMQVFAFLSYGVGIVGPIWLLIRGEWKLVAAGVLFALIAPTILSIPLLLSAPIGALAMRMQQRGNTIAMDLCALAADIYNKLLMAVCLWLVTAGLRGYSASPNAAPLLMWAYTVATAPWDWMASKEPDNVYAHVSRLSFAVASAVLLLLLGLFKLPLAVPATAFVIVMLMGTMANHVIRKRLERHDWT